MTHQQEPDLAAYLRGELSAEETAALDAQIAQDKHLAHALRQVAQAELDLHAAADLRGHRASARRGSPSWTATPPVRSWWARLALPVGALAVVGLAVLLPPGPPSDLVVTARFSGGEKAERGTTAATPAELPRYTDGSAVHLHLATDTPTPGAFLVDVSVDGTPVHSFRTDEGLPLDATLVFGEELYPLPVGHHRMSVTVRAEGWPWQEPAPLTTAQQSFDWVP